MKIALVHDFLFEYAGSERVVEQILKVFPSADLFAVVDYLRPDQRDFLAGHKAKTTFIQKIPLIRHAPARLLPFTVPMMPVAVEQLDLSAYDLILSSSHSVAKGVITGPDQIHIAYIHSPMRYAWDLQSDYLSGNGLARGITGWAARVFLSYLRLWDARTANGVDSFIANSHFIARRIWKTYRRESNVIYPPVNVDDFPFSFDKDNYYLVVSRLVPYKKIDVVIKAFQCHPEKKLIIVGDGPERKRLQRLAGPNVKLLGWQRADALKDLMSHARAFIIAAIEDFGIAPVEAQACGTPVIAFHKGGAAETVQPLGLSHPTGIFFKEQTPDSLAQAIQEFDQHNVEIDPQNCRENALRFRPDLFRETYRRFVLYEWEARLADQSRGLNVMELSDQETWLDR